jgi:hypothetical protein
MKTKLSRVPLAAVALACVLASVSDAETPAPVKSPTKAVVAAGPWAKVPALPTSCFQRAAANQPDPFYARLEAAKTAVAADIEKQSAINRKIEEEFNNIDPMEKAQRMQQWMMSNPQEAMAYMQAAQAAPAEARRKVLAGKLGYKYSSAPKDLVNPFMGFAADPSTPRVDWNEAESISSALDQKYKALCPQWWRANGKFHAYMKLQKNWFVRERIPYLEKFDAPKLQNYAMMSTPAATYRSNATLTAVHEYLDLAWKVFSQRDSASRCEVPSYCDGTYP